MTSALTAPQSTESKLPVHLRTRSTITEPDIVASETPEEVPVPDSQEGIDELRVEIDEIDAKLVELILRRTAISHAIGRARKSLGGPKIVYSREMAVLERFRALGPAGTDLGMMLLAMGRGKLGRK
ncbi:chorismate mutase [Nakamurella multipartita]|jgi:chorismate mutase|uniref:Chorismate mutase n=1 Tax=Nakamurella multipartita (strain ATCC 700099 / DSM 44233 / CIP 104796 / JCM 9543 / NBRC 105858 / Y-104) TaxID=479431 RepID=C8XDJ6_NAKMY|nr:chorismate mutase [Nakamurella multipartita]ACV77660.1 chorismate mutase [Nakamurella multipartita DSM 44233]HOZ56995.1 chorismate mutase [Nakamurella multipartita]